MTCKKCGSENITMQVVTDMKLKSKHRGIFYWLFFGWLLDLFLWIFLFLPRLIVAIFRPKRSKLVTKQKTVALCQGCGNRWNVA